MDKSANIVEYRSRLFVPTNYNTVIKVGHGLIIADLPKADYNHSILTK